ncbi:hypothetical protein U1Q18_032601 [Sarracenia purpurea var. burkii]
MNLEADSRELDLKLNLSPPRPFNEQVEPRRRSVSSMDLSPRSSCVSSELSADDDSLSLRYASSSPEPKPMMLVGCPQCLMYVMLSEEDPKCPKCKTTVLLEILHDQVTKRTKA